MPSMEFGLKRGRTFAVLVAAGVLAMLVLGAVMTSSQPAGAATAEVGVGTGGNNFAPASVTIAVGDTVNWTWVGGFHNVVAADGSFDSGAPHGTPGDPFAHTFASAGTFFYYCAVHAAATDATDAGIAAGQMVGKVVVQQSQATATATATATTTTTATATGTAAPTTTATGTVAPTRTATAAPTSTAMPTPPKTGQAGLADTSNGAGAALLLLGLTFATVFGARAVTQRTK
jgi:plastocyanin